ncbi:MAG TPA: Stealth CR1 domain-containing protein [Paludibacter sp.]|nr:Stealth CR1 domain-containing protein [Paludibacter sp.]
MNTPQPVDVVISWVDGNDPAHKKKIQPFLNPQARKSQDIAGPTRYNSVGEIFYSVASIFRFAPFVRKIFIIADEQDPGLDDFISKNFPESKIQIEIVDHAVLFRGYEHVLPVFNSRAIETCTYRIPGLSENYVYLNDDFFLVRPVGYDDWFRGDRIVAYGQWRSILLDRLLWLVKPMKNGHKPVGFKDSMITSARKLDRKWRYFHLEHMPHPLKKSVLEHFYTARPDLFESNISHKFRSSKQFNTQALYYMLMFEAKSAILASCKNVFLYMKPVRRGDKYVTRKLNAYKDNPGLKFCCIGSLDQATDRDRKALLDWLQQILNIVF